MIPEKAAAASHRSDGEGGRDQEAAGQAVEVQGHTRFQPKIQVRLEYDGPHRFAFDVVGAVAGVLRGDARFPQLSRFDFDVLFSDLEREIARAVEEGIRREVREALEEEDD